MRLEFSAPMTPFTLHILIVNIKKKDLSILAIFRALVQLRSLLNIVKCYMLMVAVSIKCAGILMGLNVAQIMGTAAGSGQ